MALDEAILEAVAAGRAPPTLRLYTFSPTSVTIGYFQGLSRSVRLDAARRLGTPVVRRFTGGGSVLHSEEGELTYSIAAPAEGVLANVVESYRVLCGAVADALRRLGADAVYEPPNDVTVGGRKISGNAQARRRGALLQHGTILLQPSRGLMEQVLVAPQVKLGSHGAASIGDRVVGLWEALGREVGVIEVAERLVEAISAAVGLEPREGWYSRWELEAARSLSRKYRSPGWLEKRP